LSRPQKLGTVDRSSAGMRSDASEQAKRRFSARQGSVKVGDGCLWRVELSVHLVGRDSSRLSVQLLLLSKLPHELKDVANSFV